MAAAAAGITTDGAVCRRMIVMGMAHRLGAITGHQPAITRRRQPGRSYVLISVDETSRATHRPIRPLRPGTTAPRITQFRMVCVSRTEVAETSFLMAQTAVQR